jgi:hypothetical protein
MPTLAPGGSAFQGPASGSVELWSETPGARIRYTLDGSEPGEQSPEYAAPIKITRAVTVKAKAFKSGLKPSLTATAFYDLLDPSINGLNYRYYEGSEWRAIPDLDRLTPVSRGIVTGFDLASIKKRQNQWGVRFFAFLNVVENGDYTFSLMSDDGSRLAIDGKTVVDNDGSHGPTEKTGTVALNPGVHAFVLDYFNDTSDELLNLTIAGPGIARRPLPVSMLTLILDKHSPTDKQ